MAIISIYADVAADDLPNLIPPDLNVPDTKTLLPGFAGLFRVFCSESAWNPDPSGLNWLKPERLEPNKWLQQADTRRASACLILEYENISTNCGYPIFLLSRISPYRAVSAASINKATLALIDRIKNYMRQKPPSFFINQGSEILRQAEKDYIPEHIKNFYGI